MGLMGAGHCATMCGPITLCAGHAYTGTPRQPLASHLGRITTYAVLGALVAMFSASATSFCAMKCCRPPGCCYPICLLLFSALYLMGFQQAYAPVEKVGRRVWQDSRARVVGRRCGGVWATFARRYVGHAALRHDLQRARSGGAAAQPFDGAGHGSLWCVNAARAARIGHAVRRMRCGACRPKPRDAGWGQACCCWWPGIFTCCRTACTASSSPFVSFERSRARSEQAPPAF